MGRPESQQRPLDGGGTGVLDRGDTLLRTPDGDCVAVLTPMAPTAAEEDDGAELAELAMFDDGAVVGVDRGAVILEFCSKR